MASVAELRAKYRARDLDTNRESRINKPRRLNPKMPHHDFHDCEDESERQLLHEQRYAEEKSFLAMAESVASSPSVAKEVLPQGPIEALESSLSSGKFSDLVVTHGKRSWNAHRVVVCAQCPELESKIKAFENKHTLCLDVFDYDAVCALIEYFYCSDYTVAANTPANLVLDIHRRVFNLSITISLPGLEELSVNKFRHYLNNFVNGPQIFFAAVRSIYARAQPGHVGLRVVLLEAGLAEMRKILQGSHKADFFRLTREVPQFQEDMYLTMLEYPDRPMEFITPDLCIDCGPRDDGEQYSATIRCIGCGKEKEMKFR